MGFRALRVFEEAGNVVSRLVEMEVDALSPGEVLIRATHSGINFKDALAVTGRGRILKRFPLNAGIDVAGVVLSSADPRFVPGDPVLVNGAGLGESLDGGFAERVRVPAEIVVPLPPALSAFEAMALGTAGFTAALCLHRMEENGQAPAAGPIVVTGASGGVGALATALFAARGYEVIAVSGREEHHALLRELGALETVTPAALGLGSRPLESGRFAGVVDNVGGELLAGLVRHVRPWGNVAVVGNAGGAELHTTVFPMILRGVSLLGVSSTNCAMPLRTALWNRLGGEWKPRDLARVVTAEIPLAEALPAFGALLDRRSHGRVVVRLG
ncbi:MAG: YhdH/YhfP family quinone oxidoreductase [Vicinamibacteria bacterium]|nr:YhdH/YhfP family quinone oxidoreductase [Vicinamibacteria bacterium]